MGEDEQFVGYHGTTSAAVSSLLQGIRPVARRNFAGFAQLGEGFYTTPDYAAALVFADVAIREAGGTRVVLEVYARGLGRMIGREVPRRLWWDLPADSPYITAFDYLTAPVNGYEPVVQRKFNPRAYEALTVR